MVFKSGLTYIVRSKSILIYGENPSRNGQLLGRYCINLFDSAICNIKPNPTNIISVCKGKRKSCGFVIKEGKKIGLTWEYKEVISPTTTERIDHN